MRTLTFSIIYLVQSISGYAEEHHSIESRLRSFCQSLEKHRGDLAKNKCPNCLEGAIHINDTLPQVVVFVSFSMPDTVWLPLSREIEKVGGVFVLQGLPSNSFKALADKIYALRQKGIHATIQLHPQLFEKYQINKVPTFLVRDGNLEDKLVGNVSLRYVLQVIETKGECQIATQLLRCLEERR